MPDENPREGFGIVAACSDNWRHTMGSQHTSHKDRLLKLEHNLSAMNTAIQNTQSLNLGVEHRRIEAMVAQQESNIPRLSHEAEISSQKVNTVMSFVEERMREFKARMNDFKQSNMNVEVPLNIVNSLNDIIMEGAPSTIIEVIRQKIEELSQVVRTDQFAIDGLRNVMIDLQGRFIATLQPTGGSSVLPSSDPSLPTSNRQMNEMRSSQRDTCSKE